MTTKTGGAAWETRAEQICSRVEEEVIRLIATVNDTVVPELRRGGSQALRAAATELTQMAEQLERHGRAPYPAAGSHPR